MTLAITSDQCHRFWSLRVIVLFDFGLISDTVRNLVVQAMPTNRMAKVKRMTDADRYAEGNYTEQNQKKTALPIPIHTTVA
jgi:hypothetical protein